MEDDPRNDAEIILASLLDPEEFAVIYRRHHPALFKFAARRVGIADAEDVLSSVFERAFRLRRRYDQRHSESLPWLYGIATNIVGEGLRRRRKEDRLYLAMAPGETESDLSEDIATRASAEALGPQINAVLSQLPQRDRNAFLLYALEGLTYAEISRSLNVPIGTIGSRISRARAVFMERLPDLKQQAGTQAPWDRGNHA